MITLKEAEALGASDKQELSAEEIETVAESFIENVGGAHGESLAQAYRKGAGF